MRFCDGQHHPSAPGNYVRSTAHLEVYHIVQAELGNQLSAILQAAQCRKIVSTGSLHSVSNIL